MASISVAVRVRPFNAREKKFQSELIVAMDGPLTELLPAGKVKQPRPFTFDQSFWSHNPDDEDFASQEKVYQSLGSGILDNSMEGFNACLFAYGQTGSGKTYTMMGSPADPGIIPRLCDDLFQRAAADPNRKVRVEVAYLEVYNEQVHDLLNPSAVGKSLKVRQHPKLGVFVEDLKKIEARSKEEIEELVESGAKVRSVAATNMNATSSRSHAILTIHINIKLPNNQLVSQLNLVDLAGSERADSTGASGSTLAEGANINKSLTLLGMCLSRLAETSGDPDLKAKTHIPYRDSQLTFLLKESLGGNSKTAMLANISPADINYEETLSTLRFAATTKKIKMHAVVNENPEQKLIRELREEIDRIKVLIDQREAGIVPDSFAANRPNRGDDDDDDDDENDLDESALMQKLLDDAEMIEKLGRSAEGRAADAAKVRSEYQAQMKIFDVEFGAIIIDNTHPSLTLLNENVVALCGSYKANIPLVNYVKKDTESVIGSESKAWIKLPPIPNVNPRMAIFSCDAENHVACSIPSVTTGSEGSGAATGSSGFASPPPEGSLGSEGILTSPTDGSSSTANAAHRNVWVNGRLVNAGCAVKIGHNDRVITGPFAFRATVPGSIEGGDDDAPEFETVPQSVEHLLLLEAHQRLRFQAEEAVEFETAHCALTDLSGATLASPSAANFGNDHPASSSSYSGGDDEEGSFRPKRTSVRFRTTSAFDSPPPQEEDNTAAAEGEAAASAPTPPEQLTEPDGGEAKAEEPNPQGEQPDAAAAAATPTRDPLGESAAGLSGTLHLAAGAELIDMRLELVRVEKKLTRDYPMSSATRRARGITINGNEIDYAFAIEERNAIQAEQLAKIKSMKEESAKRDREIAELQAELEKKLEKTQQRHAPAEDEPAPGNIPSARSGKDLWSRARKRSGSILQGRAAGAAAPGAKPRVGGESTMLLMNDVHQYEESCRRAQAWQPDGPAEPDLAREYRFSLTQPTLAQLRDHNMIVFEGTAEKLRIKTGFFSRSGYHTVHLIIIPRILAYFEKATPTSQARGAIFYHGASIRFLGRYEGKYAVRVDPSVPRKTGKMGKDNAVIVASDSEDGAMALYTGLMQWALPQPNDRVAEYYRQQAEEAAGGGDGGITPRGARATSLA